MGKGWVLLLVAATVGVPVHSQQGSPRGELTPKGLAVSWRDGKTSFDFENAQLKLSNRLQFRFSLLDNEGNPATGSFRIRRFKTKLEGWAYSKNLTFELQLNWAEDKPLDDANAAYDLTGGRKRLVIKGGQFKVPFGRQELTSAFDLQFPDRSLVSTEFARGRDIGVQLSGLAAAGTVDWRVGVFNGAGRNATANDNSKLQYDARVTWQPWGEVRYTEGDLVPSPRPLLAVAAQYERNDRRGATAANDLKRSVWGGDVVFKYRGWSVFAEYFHAHDTPEIGLPYTRKGFNLQLGYALIPSKLELATRWAELDPTDLRHNDLKRETGLAITYCFNLHAHKLQADLRRIDDGLLKKTSNELRLQYQVVF